MHDPARLLSVKKRRGYFSFYQYHHSNMSFDYSSFLITVILQGIFREIRIKICFFEVSIQAFSDFLWTFQCNLVPRAFSLLNWGQWEKTLASAGHVPMLHPKILGVKNYRR